MGKCLYEEYEQKHFREQEFIPHNVQFSNLYNHFGMMHSVSEVEADALYLLKYALFITVHQMLSNSVHHLIYIDEMALSSIIDRTTTVLTKPSTAKTHEDLGFAVAMNFQPTNYESSKALSALLRLAE